MTPLTSTCHLCSQVLGINPRQAWRAMHISRRPPRVPHPLVRLHGTASLDAGKRFSEVLLKSPAKGKEMDSRLLATKGRREPDVRTAPLRGLECLGNYWRKPVANKRSIKADAPLPLTISPLSMTAAQSPRQAHNHDLKQTSKCSGVTVQWGSV